MGKIQITDIVPYDDYQQFKAVDSAASPIALGRIAFEDNARIPKEGFAAHPEDEFVYVLKGELIFGFEDSAYTLKAGDFHYLPKNTNHYCQGKNGSGEFIYILVK